MTDRTPFTHNDVFVIVPVPRGAQAALEQWLDDHSAEVDELLMPFGLTAMDVKRPTFETFLAQEEVLNKLGAQIVDSSTNSTPGRS